MPDDIDGQVRKRTADLGADELAEGFIATALSTSGFEYIWLSVAVAFSRVKNLIVCIPVEFVQHAMQHWRKNDSREDQKGQSSIQSIEPGKKFACW